MNESDYLAERFEEHRTHLRAVAYRMLGSLSAVTRRSIDRQGNRRMAFGAGRSSAACRSRAISDGVRPLTNASIDA